MRSLRLVALALVIAGCKSAPPPVVYKSEAFNQKSPYEQFFEVPAKEACEAGRRALLSQGYLIEEGKRPDVVQARKTFQPLSDTHVELSMTLICLPEAEGSVTYANARQIRYALKAAGNSAGISVSGIGSISLPWGGGSDSLVRVGEETVTDAEFYQRFFGLMNNFIR